VRVVPRVPRAAALALRGIRLSLASAHAGAAVRAVDWKHRAGGASARSRRTPCAPAAARGVACSVPPLRARAVARSAGVVAVTAP